MRSSNVFREEDCESKKMVMTKYAIEGIAKAAAEIPPKHETGPGRGVRWGFFNYPKAGTDAKGPDPRITPRVPAPETPEEPPSNTAPRWRSNGPPEF